MGRNHKKGFDFFRTNVDFFDDLKIQRLICAQGSRAVTIYIRLLCCIYREEGYYMGWTNELPFIISQSTGVSEACVLQTLKSCLALGLINKELFDKHRVLTSRGIQERYIQMCQSLKRTPRIRKYNLLDEADADEGPRAATAEAVAEESSDTAKACNLSPTDTDNADEVAASKKGKATTKGRTAKAKAEAPKAKAAQADAEPDAPPPPVTPPPFPDNPPLTDYRAAPPEASLEAEAERMHADLSWCEAVCMQQHITHDELSAKLQEFVLHCRCEGPPLHLNLQDAKKHFCGWLRLTKNINPNDSNQQRPQARRRGNLLTADPTQEKDYGGTF